MQKVGPLFLIGVLGFALLFALLPGSQTPEAEAGITLKNVRLTLYPARDPEAVWRFAAASVKHDPVGSTTELSGISGGKRLLIERGPQGQPTGRETLDALISAPSLSINGQDDMVTPEAQIRLVKECADLKLSGTPQTPVKIEQGYGFSAPQATLDSPSIKGNIYDLRMDFSFTVEQADPNRSDFGWDPDATGTCRDGQLVPL